MGNSAKRKRDKKQDFKKTKLKVGKTKPKAANATDTSFKAKSIVLNQQSLSTTAPTATAVFSHQLSLLSSRTDSQRREAAAALTRSLTGLDKEEPLPQPMSAILEKVNPLTIDASRGIREQQLKLYQALPSSEIANHIGKILTYVHIGMMHMAADIKSTSLDVLDWLVSTAGQDVVGSAGGWYQTLDRLVGILGWKKSTDTGKWTSSQSTQTKPGADTKLRAKQLNTMILFLETGFKAPTRSEESYAQSAARAFPLCNSDLHVIGTKSNPFGYLNLFGAARDAENEMYDDAEARMAVFHTKMYADVIKGMRNAKSEGGEIGRAAAALDKLLSEHFGT